MFCKTTPRVLHLGALVLTGLCGNLWRVYRIFTYFKTKHHLISNSTLSAFIILVVGVILVVLVLWTVLDPLMVEFEQQGIEYNGKDDPIMLVRSSCHFKYFTLWTAATHSTLFLVLTLILILSSLNRQINRKYFWTSKSVNMMAYMISPACFLRTGVSFVFQSLDVHYSYINFLADITTIVCFVSMLIFTHPAYSAVKVLLTLRL